MSGTKGLVLTEAGQDLTILWMELGTHHIVVMACSHFSQSHNLQSGKVKACLSRPQGSVVTALFFVNERLAPNIRRIAPLTIPYSDCLVV